MHNDARNDELDLVYLQHDYANEMRDAWQLLGERLSILTTNEGEDIAQVGNV